MKTMATFDRGYTLSEAYELWRRRDCERDPRDREGDGAGSDRCEDPDCG